MRFTSKELDAVETALNQCLAGEVLDGYEDGSDEELSVRAAMQTALEKVQRPSTSRPSCKQVKADTADDIYEFAISCNQCACSAHYTDCPVEGCDDLAIRDKWQKYQIETIDGSMDRWLCPDCVTKLLEGLTVEGKSLKVECPICGAVTDERCFAMEKYGAIRQIPPHEERYEAAKDVR